MPDLPTRDRPPAGGHTADPSAAGLTGDLTSGHTDAPDPAVPGLGGLTPPAPDALPAVPGYDLLEEVGRGGMGVVYRARDLALNRDVAVKLIQDRFPANGPAARRFAHEAAVTAQLQHPGIPPVHQVGATAGGRPFLAMKLIKGRTLDGLLADPVGWNPERERRGGIGITPSLTLGVPPGGPAAPGSPNLVAVFEAVCQAVGYAHAHGVVHRDLKPANVMVGAFGEVQVMDWGLAKVLLSGGRQPPECPPDQQETAPGTEVVSARERDDATRAGDILGTYAYMPPEQAIGAVDQIDARSDVFGLGAILCAVLTGKPPYAGGTAESTRQLCLRAKLDDAHARLDGCGAEPELVALCRRCLSVEKTGRPADAGEVAAEVAALRAAADERARQAELDRATAAAEAREQRKRRRVQLALAGAVGLLLAAGGGFAWWQDKQATERKAEQTRLEDAARQERAVRGERARVGVEATLAGLPELYQRGLWKRAEAALADADALLGPDGDPGLRERVTTAKRDTAFIARLDRIRLDKLAAVTKTGDAHATVRSYDAAFREHGFDVPAGDIPDLGRRLNASPVRDYLVAALDDWAVSHFGQPDAFRRLFAVTAAATGQGWRADFADALASRDGKRLAAVYDAIPPGQRSPSVAFIVGGALYRSDGGRRLEDGLRQFPTDLWLHIALGAPPGEGPVERAVGACRAALALRPGDPQLLNSLGVALRHKGDVDGAVACYLEAAGVDPGYAEPHINLGVMRAERRDFDGAIAAYREAIRRQPDNALAHLYLGLNLSEKGNVAGAEDAFREAIRLDANNSQAHFNLGKLLADKGDEAGEEAAYREAIRLDPKLAEAYCNLGVRLGNQGRLDEALALLRKGHELGTQRKDWPYPSADWVKACERLVALDRQLSAVKAGSDTPDEATEAAELAWFAYQPYKREYALAVRLYADAFAADPKLVEAGTNRYDAACAAVRLAAGDDPSAVIGWDEWGILQDRAFGWLTAQLGVFRRLAGSADPAERARAARGLAHWQKDIDMASVREPARRAWMPAPDRERWDKFWAEVEAVRQQAAK